MDPFELRRRIRDLVEPTVQRLGFDLVAVEWAGGVLRLSLDGPEGIGADQCVAVSRRLSLLLDEADPIQGSYTLEVSSPGMERPVERLEDFRRFAGYRVKVRLLPGHPRRRYTGTIKGAEGEEVVLEVDGEEHRVDHESIERAHLDLDLDAYERLAAELYQPAASKEQGS